MAVEFRDYYAVLGVPRDASEADIKQAFRARARQYHPDVAKDKATAEDKFKELNEANEVLSDPEKRRQYDELGANWNHPERQAPAGRGGRGGFGGGAPGGAGGGYHFEGTGFSDFFAQFFGRHGQPGARPGGGMGGAAPGGFGRGAEPGWDGGAPGAPGQDYEDDIVVTLAEVVHGATRTITLQTSPAGGGPPTLQTLRVRIPAGVHEGQLIRLAGKGQEGQGGGAAGHLYLRVKLATHPDFRVRGSDLYYELALAPWEAVLGAAVQLPTLDGQASLKVPPGTTAERQFRLRGKGLPTGDGVRGDLYAVVTIQVPAATTPAEQALWTQLAAGSAYNPRISR